MFANVKIKKIGRHLGFVIPEEVVKGLNIKDNDELIIDIPKKKGG